jgi:hypothetical protein
MKIEPSSGLSSTFVSFMDEYVLLCAATHSDTVVTSGAMSANTPVVTTEIRFSTSRALGIFVSCEWSPLAPNGHRRGHADEQETTRDWHTANQLDHPLDTTELLLAVCTKRGRQRHTAMGRPLLPIPRLGATKLS